MKLDYKASNIAKAEREYGENFFDTLTTLGDKPSISGLLFLFKAGNGTEEEFDAIFEEGVEKGTVKVILSIMEGLSDAGFLSQEEVRVIKRQMEDVKKAQEASRNSGATAKS